MMRVLRWFGLASRRGERALVEQLAARLAEHSVGRVVARLPWGTEHEDTPAQRGYLRAYVAAVVSAEVQSAGSEHKLSPAARRQLMAQTTEKVIELVAAVLSRDAGRKGMAAAA